MTRLLIATSNPGKLREYGVLLDALDLELLTPRDVDLASLDVPEPYDTFEENATHKAREYARIANLPALADDSGLEVDALNGRPGVYSARYVVGTDADRYNRLLGELKHVPDEQRGARFVAVVACALPDGQTISARGEVLGTIAREPVVGETGFGFDPVFIPQGYDRPFSTLPMDEKNKLSHRGRALANLLAELKRFLA